MVPFGSTASTQIRFLLQSVNDSNFDSVFLELTQFIDYGLESSILLLQSCLVLHHFEGVLEKSIENPNHILLGTIIRYLLSKPNFSTILCESLRRNNNNSGSSGDDNNNGPVVKSVYVLGPLVNQLEFTVFERIAFGLALCDSEDVDARRFGQSFCVSHIEEVLSAHHNGNRSIVDCSSEVIQSIVLFLTRTEGVAKHVDSFMQLVALVERKTNWGSADLAVLTPLRSSDNADEMRNLDMFYSENDDFDDILEEIEKEMSMADIVKELGYGCTVNDLHCKEMLSLFLPLSEVTISRLLSTIARSHGVLEEDGTHSTFCSALGLSPFDDPSLLSTWNVEVLVESIKQLAPDTDWIHVMENLDHEGLYFPSEGSFSFFMSVYRIACQDPFPLHAICGTVWNNVEGQISFLKYAVSASPEVFTFEHSARQLVYVDAVHGHKLATGNANQAWICLDLLDVLCQLSETGHAGSIRLMLDYPLKHCPEVLLLGLSQTNTAYNLLQHEVLSAVFPMVVRNLSRAGVILHLWNINPNVVLRGLLDVQNFDSEGMIKTFDMCQELKILSRVLDMTPFSFSIKLAALASGKGQINLEKWLNDNLSTYGDTFFEGCLKFFKEIHVGVPQDVLQHAGAVVIAYLETVPIFIKVLQGHAGQNVSRRHLLEELKKLHVVFIQNSTKLQNGEVADSSSPDGVYSDDVEGEANSYFHQMFSGQLSTDAMVQMLARFKESPDKREQDIYNFMIGNLFEEYKFFPKYPERQLKIVAVLFGSLIKHQLVTHLLLGVALRAVLDALRKSADSKMFVFGAKALEQFVDRLIEWPQYCNHILQISHLRSTHSELVMFIECALASISSSHTESNGGSVVPTDHQGPNPVTLEHVEVSESSWKTKGSSSSVPVQSRPQLSLSPSPFQVQQRNQVSPDDRHKSAGQLQSVGSAHDAVVGIQKTIVAPPLATVLTSSAPSVPVPVPTSTSFLRTSRVPTTSIPRQQSSTGFGSALNIETLVAAAERRDSPIEVPASETQDRILFLINNISSANFETKAKELTEVLNEEFYPWFAQYMVMKRASIEPNYHDQYLKFLDKVNSKVLNKEIVKATYENCKVLLRSELIKSSSEERSLLKNLGSWLGKLTIGRNQVLRAREIDPKALIIEAYEKGLMIAVIPFTSKILEPCQSSLAYRPPNPWTMGILGLLAEIYALPNLKMNLKFDIEVLLKNLGVEMKDVKPTSLLKDRIRELEGNPDFSNKDVMATKPQIIPEVNPPISVEPQADVMISSHPGGLLTEDEKMPALTLPERLPSGQGLPVTPSQSPFSVSQIPTPIANIGTDVIVNPKISALGLQLQFQRIVPMAMERAIKEIMSPVVQRSVTIAIQTTKELVLKDYAMESDETRIYNAAHLMVASLAGSLAHVTCKEPLRVSISSHLRNMIQPLNISNDLEQAVQISTNDNLDLGCAVVEKAAIEKALQTIDGEIAGQLAVRRKRRDAVGAAYFDAATYTQGPMGGVPEALRPKPGRLSLSQQRVYEDFVRFPWQNQPSQSSNALPAVQSSFAGGSGSSSLPRSYGPASGQPNPTLYSSTQGDPGFGSVVQPLALVSEDVDTASAQILSASSAHIGASDVVSQHGSDIDSVVPSFPSTIVSTEPISVDPSDSTKDSGASAQPLPESFGTEHLSTSVGDLLSTEDVLEKYHIVAQKIEDLISKDSKDVEIQGVIVEVPEIILRSVSRDEAAVVVARDVFKSICGNISNNTHVGAQISILVALRDVCKVAVKEQLTGLVIYSEDEYKFNKDIIVGLIRSELLNLAEYGMHMAKLIDAGRNTTATEFAISLLQALVTQESGVGVSELHNLIEALAKLTTRPGSPESLPQLLEIARDVSANALAPSGYMVSNDEKANQSRKAPSVRSSVSRGDDYSNVESMTADPHGFREQVTLLFNEWYRICDATGTNDAAVTRFVSQLQQSGLLKGDDMTDRFFRLLTELSVAHCLSTEVFTPGSLSLQSSQQAPALSFVAIDMYAKLVVLILKYCALDQGSNKLFLLPKILLVSVRAIQKDADERKIAFNPRPYFRLFVNWLLDLGSSDSVLEGANFQILTAFANAFHALQPLKVPGFSYAWLELVSHRSFMPKLLYGNSQKTSPYVQRLLVDLFKFMEPYLRNAGKSQLGDPVHFLYKGTLRVLLVLLHDFPEFLCNYHFSFCDVIPPSCIQMRNVILSAFPRNMRLPDPSTPNLKIDLLAEISQSPCIFSDVDAAVKAKQMKGDIDEYLKTRQQGPSFLAELKQRVLLSQGEAALAGTRYNVPLMNSLVLYVGMQAIQQLQTKTPPSPQMTHTAPMDIFLVGSAMDIFQTLIGDLDTEGRYLFLNAVANQLRYPNNHTHYFSFVLLYLFAEANQEAVQEQITRVLLERLIANRPHPWGLLITFIELIKNPRYNFWTCSFTRCAPEIEKLFESVSRSCGGPKTPDESLVSDGGAH
ncbi:CCR4-NOT transcription complex subunit 1-like [Papaver somniferum]|uniref:CCR4-NOT transcription complex subunit 1-like n=1 Tax=Papaver somniferum TaxID=3469 RepID=UPI000E6FD3BF|nr:CCR4-NOT transcription complex subunit 1-like [Papaver somniferum]